MGFWDDLLDTFRSKRNELAADAAQKAAATAADQAWKQTTEKVSGAGDAFVGSLEEDLAKAEAARSGRADARPDSAEADDIAARIEAAAKGSAASTPEPDEPEASSAEEREAKARAELARLKRELLEP